MSDIQTTLKLNGLNCLLFGALFVFAPLAVTQFLSDTHPAPELLVAILGIVLNLYGLLLLWIGKQHKPHPKVILAVAIGDFLWVIATLFLIALQIWITTINGITAAGVVAIIVGRFGWIQWQYHADNK